MFSLNSNIYTKKNYPKYYLVYKRNNGDRTERKKSTKHKRENEINGIACISDNELLLKESKDKNQNNPIEPNQEEFEYKHNEERIHRESEQNNKQSDDKLYGSNFGSKQHEENIKDNEQNQLIETITEIPLNPNLTHINNITSSQLNEEPKAKKLRKISLMERIIEKVVENKENVVDSKVNMEQMEKPKFRKQDTFNDGNAEKDNERVETNEDNAKLHDKSNRVKVGNSPKVPKINHNGIKQIEKSQESTISNSIISDKNTSYPISIQIYSFI